MTSQVDEDEVLAIAASSASAAMKTQVDGDHFVDIAHLSSAYTVSDAAAAASHAAAAKDALEDTFHIYGEVSDVVGKAVQEHPAGYFADPFVGYFYPFPRHYHYHQYLYSAYTGHYDCLGDVDSDDDLSRQYLSDDDLARQHHPDDDLACQYDEETGTNVSVPWVPKRDGSIRVKRKWSQARAGGAWMSKGLGYFTYGTFGGNRIEF